MLVYLETPPKTNNSYYLVVLVIVESSSVQSRCCWALQVVVLHITTSWLSTEVLWEIYSVGKLYTEPQSCTCSVWLRTLDLLTIKKKESLIFYVPKVKLLDGLYLLSWFKCQSFMQKARTYCIVFKQKHLVPVAPPK